MPTPLLNRRVPWPSWLDKVSVGVLVIGCAYALNLIAWKQAVEPDPDFQMPAIARIVVMIGGRSLLTGSVVLIGLGFVAFGGWELWQQRVEVRRQQNLFSDRAERLSRLVADDQPVEAMRLYRQWTGCSLQQAKDVIDALRKPQL